MPFHSHLALSEVQPRPSSLVAVSTAFEMETVQKVNQFGVFWNTSLKRGVNESLWPSSPIGSSGNTTASHQEKLRRIYCAT